MSSAQSRSRAGKFGKAKRGGGRHFSRNLRPVDDEGVEKSIWAEEGEEDSDDSEEDSDEESSEDEAPGKEQEDMTREERRAAAKARKEAAIKKKQGAPQVGDLPSDSEEEDEDMPANPNHSASARKMAEKAVADPQSTRTDKVKKPTDQLSRREREALQAQQAKERWQKMHAEGKTDEARADLERLKLVRQEREEAAARKQAEKAERDEIDKEKKAQLERIERQQALKAARGARGSKKGGKS